RRRHTRLVSDWSSDVCSSDLRRPFDENAIETRQRRGVLHFGEGKDILGAVIRRFCPVDIVAGAQLPLSLQRNRPSFVDDSGGGRSEERRVGKEGRWRWGAEHE